MNNPINNEVFDSRDVIEYKEYLEETLVDSWNEYWAEYIEELEDEEIEEAEDIDGVDFKNEGFYDEFYEDIEHYEEIAAFVEELGSNAEYGESIIHEDYFEEYVEDFAKDCGYISRDFPSWIEIDWEATAENIKQDYSEIEYDGDSYYILST